VLHDDFREARLAAGLTVSELARRAGVSRKQVQALERGANVTTETVRRVAEVLPNLKRVTLGGLEIVTANADLEEARRAALDLFDVAKRLLGALGAAPAPPAAEPPQAAAGATRFTPGTASERETAARLERTVAQMKSRKKRNDS